MSQTHIGIGLLGFGTVGSSVYSLLREKNKEIQEKYGFSFEVRKILVRDPKAKRKIPLPAHLIAKDFGEIIRDDSIDVVIEVMGGDQPAKEYILQALKAGKNVITANKKLMASDGERLVAKARQNDRYLGFMASVTGCHEFCPSLANSILVRRLVGVFNSTSNYILSEIEKGLSFEDAVSLAQRNGYAESDPSADVDGLDTRNKLIIISRLAFGFLLTEDNIPVEGIRSITRADMKYADELGHAIKLLGIVDFLKDGSIDARVHPCLVSKGNLLAHIKGIANGIQVSDDIRGMRGMSADGAGGDPTASAIYMDLISMAHNPDEIIWRAPDKAGKKIKFAKPNSRIESYYVRVFAKNHPGVLARISRVLGRHRINIISVVQKEPAQSGFVPIVFMCGPAREKEINLALNEISSIKIVNGKPLLLHVENHLPSLSE